MSTIDKRKRFEFANVHVNKDKDLRNKIGKLFDKLTRRAGCRRELRYGTRMVFVSYITDNVLTDTI